MTRPLLGLFLVALLVGPVGAEDDLYDPVTDVDLALIERVAAGWPPAEDLAALRTAMRLELPEETRDLGFGTTWRRYEDYGDALSLCIDVVARDAEVAGVRLYVMDTEPPLVQALEQAFGAGVVDADKAWSTRYERTESMKRVRQAVWSLLGTPPAGTLPEPTRKAVERLTDSLAELTFGTMCSEDGGPPEGRPATDVLHAHASLDVLHHVLVGPNAEGRVYAAETLLVLEREGLDVGAKRRAVLDALRALEIPIRTCYGCEVLDEKAADLLTPERVAGLYLCRIVERVEVGDAFVDKAVLDVTWRGSFAYRLLPAPGESPDGPPRTFRGAVPPEIAEALQTLLREGTAVETAAGVTIFEVPAVDPRTPVPESVRAMLEHARAASQGRR